MLYEEIKRIKPQYNLRNIKRINYNENLNNKKRKVLIEDDQAISVSNKKRKLNNELLVDINEDNILTNWDEFNKYVSADNIPDSYKIMKNELVSASNIKNYLLKDPLLDWLDLYYKNLGYNETGGKTMRPRRNLMTTGINCQTTNSISLIYEDKNKNLLCEKGIKFEDEVIRKLRTIYPNDIKRVIWKKDLGNIVEMTKITVNYMREGVPIIEQAALYNESNQTYGVADLLIRSDWLNTLFESKVIDNDEINIPALLIRNKYHYRVIDIKWTTLYLCAEGKTIRNNYRAAAYKGQLAIYNAALGLLQGYIPNEAYILSKGWNIINKNGKSEGYDCFSRLGSVEFMGFDNKYLKETINAIQWVRNVRYNGYKWTCLPPSIPELYPNMCNKYDESYSKVKKDLSDRIKELTQIYMVGYKNRRISHDNGVLSWNDPNCSSKIMGINGKKIGPIVDAIIKINREDDCLIKPIIIKNNSYNWQERDKYEFYIDFETINGCLYNDDINLENSKTENQIVFLIGIGYAGYAGYSINKSWIFHSFLSEKPDLNEEKRIFGELVSFLDNSCKNNKIKLFHWGNAEKSIFNTVNKRHNNIFNSWSKKVIWIDMCKIFIQEPIIIKSAMKYNLKEIAKAMYINNFIQSKWDIDGPGGGLEAMIDAIKYYNSTEQNSETNKIIQSIIKYNEIDCKVVWEIVSFLRNNHI